MNTRTSRLAISSATSTTAKALLFGTAASLALVLGMAQAQSQKEMRAEVITLDPVVITVKRERLPTVYITGRRAVSNEAAVAVAE